MIRIPNLVLAADPKRAFNVAKGIRGESGIRFFSFYRYSAH